MALSSRVIDVSFKGTLAAIITLHQHGVTSKKIASKTLKKEKKQKKQHTLSITSKTETVHSDFWQQAGVKKGSKEATLHQEHPGQT